MPGRPTCPVISESAMRQRALSVPCTCCEMPIPHRIIDPFDVAYIRATSRIVCAGMPHTGAIASGLWPATFFLSSSNPLVRLATKLSATSPSSTIVCIIALRSATSVSGFNCRKCVAWRASSERRGSARMSFVPRFTAFLIHVAATG